MAKILLVDDELHVLDGYRRTLRKQFEISTAISAAQGLVKLEEEGPFVAVVSDMQMPEMNGVEFLHVVRKKYPNVVRMMLTGNADQQTPSNAINQADIFKFLNKPCHSDAMAEALNEAVEKFNSDAIERRLLQETLNGAVKGLLEILSITKPDIFGQSSYIVKQAVACARLLGWDNSWELETSAGLCLVGLVTVPYEILDKVKQGESLTTEQNKVYLGFPETGAKLVEHIPRMDAVAKNIRYLLYEHDIAAGNIEASQVPNISKLLRPIIDLNNLANSGVTRDQAFDRMLARGSLYDRTVVDALAEVCRLESEQGAVIVDIKDLGTNMFLAEALRSVKGVVLVVKNQHISESLANRLANFSRSGLIEDRVSVIIEGESEPYA